MQSLPSSVLLQRDETFAVQSHELPDKFGQRFGTRHELPFTVLVAAHAFAAKLQHDFIVIDGKSAETAFMSPEARFAGLRFEQENMFDCTEENAVFRDFDIPDVREIFAVQQRAKAFSQVDVMFDAGRVRFQVAEQSESADIGATIGTLRQRAHQVAVRQTHQPPALAVEAEHAFGVGDMDDGVCCLGGGEILWIDIQVGFEAGHRRIAVKCHRRSDRWKSGHGKPQQ